MLITRTETFTDWIYQGAHAGEQAAHVGVGLFKGTIYFRYAHDFLKAGDIIQREESFVHLSDGSTYPLGQGLSSEKITITYHGLDSGGEVILEVEGKPDMGVGVSRVTRNVTIQYDDGKVPVLDTDQLNGMLSGLTESLTESMVDTANAVKEELREELKTGLIDTSQELVRLCNVSKQDAITEAVAEADETSKARILVSRNEIAAEVDQKIASTAKYHIAQWGRLGQSLIAPNTAGTLFLANNVTYNLASDVITHNQNSNSVKLLQSDKPRVFSMQYSARMTFDLALTHAHWGIRFKDTAGNILEADYFTLEKVSNYGNGLPRIAKRLDVFIPAGLTHPAVNQGIIAEVWNSSEKNIAFNNMEFILTVVEAG